MEMMIDQRAKEKYRGGMRRREGGEREREREREREEEKKKRKKEKEKIYA